MASGNSQSGNLISNDGKNWVDARTHKPYDGVVVGATQITNSSLNDASPATEAPLPTSYMPSPAMTTPVSGLASGIADTTGAGAAASDLNLALQDPAMLGLAEGGPIPPVRDRRAVLTRKPIGPVPVLHTTIVIAAKPKEKKPEKKAMGGNLKQADRRPLKPNAIPPLRGPQDGGRPLPHGRVQVPRGSGAAIRGKRFGGIF